MLFKSLVLFLVTILNCCSLGYSVVCCPSVKGECFDSGYPYSLLPNPDCPAGDFKPWFELYTRDNKDYYRYNLNFMPWERLMSRSLYRFIVHERKDSTRNENLIALKNSLLIKENANVIFVDWFTLSNYGWYPTSFTNTRTLGAYMALVFEKIMEKQSDAKIWCIGHGMGAHACGHAGQRKKIDRITGLDPSGEHIRETWNNNRGLSPDDADFVDVIHSSSYEGGFKRMGHADFYANGGSVQPGCGTFYPACNHESAIKYLTQSLKNKCGLLWKCPNIWNFYSCTDCPNCVMGYDADRTNHGAFWATVAGAEPYCKA